MADPITIVGAVASVVQLVDFTTRVLTRLNEYRSESNKLPVAFRHIDRRLHTLQVVLNGVEQGISKQAIPLEDAKAIQPCLQGCQQQIEELNSLLFKILPSAQDKTATKVKKGVLSIRAEPDIAKLDKAIETYVDTLTIYCSWSSSRLDSRTDNTLVRLQQWLASHSPHAKLETSLKLRTPDTGKWYLESAQYTSWKTGVSSYAWLYGSAGSGKTIISAGIIDDLQIHCKDDPARTLAFFFFDFSDATTQSPISMVKSLLSQLLPGCPRIPEVVRSLHAACQNGGRTATDTELIHALEATLQDLPSSFIVLDALDECTDRDGLLDTLEEVRAWNIGTARLLFTSRKEIDIEEAMEDLVPSHSWASLESYLVDDDIRIYVHERLETDKAFKSWQKRWRRGQDKDIEEEIETTIGSKACGMFRWAACQMDDLAGCLNRGMIRRALRNLPKTLDETYDRIVATIDKSQTADVALKVLRWLTYAERPLTVTEVFEVTGILTDDDTPRFDADEVLRNSQDILRICSSFVSITSAAQETLSSEHENDEPDEIENDDRSVQLAHFSVKEYLVSSRSSIARFKLQAVESNNELACSCLIYLLRFQRDEWREPDFYQSHPLIRYAARHWTKHARDSKASSQLQQRLTMVLLTESAPAFMAWQRPFFNEYGGYYHRIDTLEAHRRIEDAPNPLTAAAIGGLAYAARVILDDPSIDVNADGSEYGTALHEASFHGYIDVVELLLAKGANVNSPPARHGTPLKLASSQGHIRIVQLLLAKSADVNTPHTGSHGTALQAASSYGHLDVVELLLAKGADVNTPETRPDGNPLQVASLCGYLDIVKLLLAKGADVNAPQISRFGTALQAASRLGHLPVVELLLAKGAEVNTPRIGVHGTALQAASKGYRNLAVVKLLLAHGADVNASGPEGPALLGASYYGRLKVVEQLLAKGADINALGPKGTALECATAEGHQDVMDLLLANGAEPVGEEGQARVDVLRARAARFRRRS